VLVANPYQHAPNTCIEVGRQNMPGPCRPSFSDLEEALKAAAKQDAA
jgi:chemotaxis protein MotA